MSLKASVTVGKCESTRFMAIGLVDDLVDLDNLVDDDAVILTPGSTPCPSDIERFHSATRF